MVSACCPPGHTRGAMRGGKLLRRASAVVHPRHPQRLEVHAEGSELAGRSRAHSEARGSAGSGSPGSSAGSRAPRSTPEKPSPSSRRPRMAPTPRQLTWALATLDAATCRAASCRAAPRARRTPARRTPRAPPLAPSDDPRDQRREAAALIVGHHVERQVLGDLARSLEARAGPACSRTRRPRP